MKIVRFVHKKKVQWGVLEGTTVALLKKEPFEKIEYTKKKIALTSVKLLAPVIPSKIILAGLNYYDHVKEMGMPVPSDPVIFIKPSTTVIGTGDTVVYPQGVTRLDYEAELAIVIKKKARNIAESDVANYIFGYTCLNDVTARDLQKKDGQWTRAKSFDTFCPIGPWIETDFDSSEKTISARLNGHEKQRSSTSQFIFPIPYLVSFISRVMTLYPGDVISTGTPPGIGPMKKGDTIEIEIEGIGTLVNTVG